MQIMTDAVYHARYVVCFSETIKDRALFLWPNLCPERLKVISQAVETAPSQFDLLSHLREEQPDLACLQSPDTLKLFLLVAGIRPVKNPTYLVSAFQEWHSREENVLLVVIGHRLNQEYVSKVFEPAVNKSPGVVYLPGLPMEDVHAALTQATALVNTSDSEGMCLSILEAMKLGLPVLARDIPANCAIVSNGLTGLLFDSPQMFLEKAQLLLSSSDVRQTLVTNARRYVNDQHNMEKERHAYISLLQQCIAEVMGGAHLVQGAGSAECRGCGDNPRHEFCLAMSHKEVTTSSRSNDNKDLSRIRKEGATSSIKSD
ncbi:glycosyltransferase 1 domain-containing protein 1 [Aplysia californica]|uniref:Glycosyltransferase 1 domain-containing protein 1 n=1 Tax=Aplysia californica TaxID=6500 RepID=A0ABM1A5H5_APLCA|nr:glycosyltransferase 1 domain-containing protein 1 [Aplysia californica]